MSAVKLPRKSKANNAAPAAAEQAQPANLVEQSAAVWAAVEYLAGKNGRRDDLTAGGSHNVKLQIVAQVDNGPVYSQQFDGALTIGHDSEVAPSATPGGDKLLIAVALSKLNAATREAVMREVLASYGENVLPEAPAEIIAAVESLQKQIRGLFRSKRRGSVKFDGKPAQPSLSLLY